MDRGRSDVVLDYGRAYSSIPRPLEHAKAARVLEQVSGRLEHARVQRYRK